MTELEAHMLIHMERARRTDSGWEIAHYVEGELLWTNATEEEATELNKVAARS